MGGQGDLRLIVRMLVTEGTQPVTMVGAAIGVYMALHFSDLKPCGALPRVSTCTPEYIDFL